MVVSPSWLEDVRELASVHKRISAGMIHRRLRIPRKGGEALLHELELEGIVGPPSPGGSRVVVKHG